MRYCLSLGSHQAAQDFSVCGLGELAICQCLQVCAGRVASY